MKTHRAQSSEYSIYLSTKFPFSNDHLPCPVLITFLCFQTKVMASLLSCFVICFLLNFTTCFSSPSVLLFCFPLCWTHVACNYFQPGIKKQKSSLTTHLLLLTYWKKNCISLVTSSTLLPSCKEDNQLASWYSRVSFILMSTLSTRRKKRSNKKKLVGITLCIIKTKQHVC